MVQIMSLVDPESLIVKEEYHVFGGQLCVCVLWTEHVPYSGESDIGGSAGDDGYISIGKAIARGNALSRLSHYNSIITKGMQL